MRILQPWFTAIIAIALFTSVSPAEVRTRGDISPAPNSNGGTIAGTLTVGVGVTNGNTLVGVLTLDGGTQLTVGDGIFGDRLGANGAVFVQGAGSQLTSNDDIFVGNDGYGELAISSEAWVANTDDFSIGVLDDGRGWVSVSGSGTFLNVGDQLMVGVAGIGNLSAQNASRVISTSGIVGSSVNSVGNVQIQGNSSWRMRDDLTIALAGTGSLTIAGGGLVENDTARIGSNASAVGNVLVTGSQSIWLHRQDLVVGNTGEGTLQVRDGGLVQVIRDMFVNRGGRVELRDGRITSESIAIVGSVLGSGIIEGTMSIGSPGSLRADDGNTLVVVSNATNAGLVEAMGGSLSFERPVTNESTGKIVGRDGTLRFHQGLVNNGSMGFGAGTSDVFGSITNGSNGKIQAEGESQVTFFGDVASVGNITIGPDAHITFVGNVNLAAAASLSLSEISLHGTEEEGVAVVGQPLSIAGQFVANGDLRITASPDPERNPEPSTRGATIVATILTAESIAGEFRGVTYNGSAISLDFIEEDGKSFRGLDSESDAMGLFRTISYSPSSIELFNYLAIEGDIDGDGDVDFADFLKFGNHFGETGNWLVGDFDGDQNVGFSDFLSLSNNFGELAAMTFASVPEPETNLALLGLVALTVLSHQRFRFLTSSLS